MLVNFRLSKPVEKPEDFIATYDYLDDMPLAGWIWEFMRRDKEYQKFFERHHDALNSETSEYKKMVMKAYRLNFSPMPIQSPSVKASSRIFTDKFYLPIAMSLGTATDNNSGLLELILRFISEANNNILMLFLDISAPQPIDDLIAQIKSEIMVRKKKVSQKRKGKRSGAKGGQVWKWYLIMFDLCEQFKKTPKEIADFFINTEFDAWKEVPNIRRCIKSGKKLINGGYKAFLPFLNR